VDGVNAAHLGGAPIRRHASKADVAERTGSGRASKARAVIDGPDGPELLTLPPRVFWALRELIRAGARGVSTLDNPAPRWSAYVHRLRREGVMIETEMEPHHGAYPGHHARYRLRSRVRIEGGAA
jgi:hypothetical protein